MVGGGGDLGAEEGEKGAVEVVHGWGRQAKEGNARLPAGAMQQHGIGVPCNGATCPP